MTPHLPHPASADTLLALVRIARRILEALPKDRPVPREIERELSTFYQLAEYHGIAPADAPHIPDDGMI